MSEMIHNLMRSDLAVVGIVLTIMAICLIYRIIRGPHAVDRLAAADSIDVIIGVVMVIFGCYEDRSLYVDLGLITALLGFIETILISKYLEGKL
ncbi:monovalent cation/H+ antiporter complex subunit F [Clostridium thermarum]|uniref:monovalent cation/H+ antiporter complex subunit F n=1 Tax=Clostridium thermarum TaxID=1716543 RepID=UPI001FAA5F99|nr:monovalent cation/H+ antiporter complex subunit F [Clostridium thermarum]